MFLSKKHLPRRTFLKGLGATVALPMLDAMTPALATAAQSAAPPVRLSIAYVPNGVVMEHWKPTTTGTDFQLKRIMQPFAPYQKDMLVLSNLGFDKPKSENGQEAGNPGGHATAGSLYLTGIKPKKTIGLDVEAGVSFDQVAAQAIGKSTRFPSLELSCDDTRSVGNCDSGYSCLYSNTLSWRSPTSPMPPETNPRLVFERLFGTDDPSIDAATRARRALYRKSILDNLGDHASSLMNTLGASDRRKVDEYLYGIREVEKQLATAQKEGQVDPGIGKPAGIPAQFVDHLKLMFDLQILAFQADLTRVQSLLIGREGSLRTYPEIGVRESHHPLTHHRDNPEFIEKVAQINCYHTQLYTYFLDKLRSIPEGNGTLLDNCVAMYGSGMSEGNSHAHYDLPTVVFGKGGGKLQTGRHISYQAGDHMTSLHLGLLDVLGVHPEHFGGSHKPLSFS